MGIKHRLHIAETTGFASARGDKSVAVAAKMKMCCC